jgi:hypothetical protein
MSQAVVVFTGPTLSAAESTRELPESRVVGPAACGDVYRAALARPRALVLIDGYFDQKLSVWHKELLWALAQGIRVYGGASMGALRAVELTECGMTGVGVVYEQYLSGILEDDDEVAVAHADESREYAPQSTALVNVRATLRTAVVQGIIDSADEARLIAAGKSLYYPDRTLAAILGGASLESGRLARLRDWLGVHGVVDQKAIDARALLARVRDDLVPGATPSRRAVPKFVPTNAWNAFVASVVR